ncbi:MAG: hypothetical protein JO072_11090 [Parafilimonas sp.]|nr:hypothetical protein [Parafilimonas sp.]
MELEEFKDAWKQSETYKNLNTNIMNLIQHKTYGPVAALKKEFRKQIIVMCLLPMLLIFTNLDDISKPLTSILFWAYVLLCAGIIVFAYFNLRITNQMSVMDESIKPNLEKQVNTLEKRIRWKITGLRIALLFLIVLTEIVPYIQHYQMLDKWHSLSPIIRFGCYTALLLFQYFIGREVVYRKFGSHISYLKELIHEME